MGPKKHRAYVVKAEHVVNSAYWLVAQPDASLVF